MKKIIGIAGTAKNTGKTTTIMSILRLANEKKINTGITSIGYDGEELDNITDLPKPRVYLSKDNFVATVEKAVLASDADLEIVKKTEFENALGRIIICKVNKPGYVILAGPNKKKDLASVIKNLQGFNQELILIDGALNRIVPMSVADGLILATGAAKNENIENLAKETNTIVKILNLPEQKLSEDLPTKNKIVIYGNDYTKTLRIGSLLSQKYLQEIIKLLNQGNICFIPGAVNGNLLIKLFSHNFSDNKKIIVKNSLRIIAGLEKIEDMQSIIKNSKFKKRLKVEKAVNLKAVTINPFYPKFRYKTKEYSTSYVDKEKLKTEIKKYQGQVPILNVKRKEDLSNLAKLL